MQSRNSGDGSVEDSARLRLRSSGWLGGSTRASLFLFKNVYDEAVSSITQILETTGADLRVSIEGSNREQLFRRIPKR
jgi:hypothetical protein